MSKFLDYSGLSRFKSNLDALFATKEEVESLILSIDNVEYVVADSLPTASADTLKKIYLIPVSQGSSTRTQYWTEQSGSSYSWVAIGTTEMDISNCLYLGDVVESNVTIST